MCVAQFAGLWGRAHTYTEHRSLPTINIHKCDAARNTTIQYSIPLVRAMSPTPFHSIQMTAPVTEALTPGYRAAPTVPVPTAQLVASLRCQSADPLPSRQVVGIGY